MKDSGSRAQGFKYYEKLLITLSRELKALDALNNSRLWMTWVTPGHEPMALDAMKSSELWMIWMTQDPMSLSPSKSCEFLKIVDDVNDSPSRA